MFEAFFKGISVSMFMIHIQKEVQLADSNDILFQEDLDRGGDLYK